MSYHEKHRENDGNIFWSLLPFQDRWRERLRRREKKRERETETVKKHTNIHHLWNGIWMINVEMYSIHIRPVTRARTIGSVEHRLCLKIARYDRNFIVTSLAGYKLYAPCRDFARTECQTRATFIDCRCFQRGTHSTAQFRAVTVFACPKQPPGLVFAILAGVNFIASLKACRRILKCLSSATFVASRCDCDC